MLPNAFVSDAPVERELDNPVWSCLSTRHAHLARGGDHARRYPPEISPIAGVPDAGRESAAALEALFGVGENLVMGGPFMPTLSPGWEILHESRLLQMVRRERAPAPEGDAAITVLNAADAPEMLALADLAQPGPFRARTRELGTYVGIRRQGRLVAMAGERMWIGDHREVSAVCTHPDALGRGYARALVSRLINRMLRAGQVPFLHVEWTNARAIELYRTLGFVERRELLLLSARLKPDRRAG